MWISTAKKNVLDRRKEEGAEPNCCFKMQVDQQKFIFFFHYLVKVGIKFKRCAGTFQIACFPWLTFDYVRAKHNSKYFHNRNIVSLFRMRKLERIAQLDEEVRRLKAEKEELGEVKKIYLKNVSLEWSANFLLKKLAKKVFRLWEFLKFILLWSLILSGYPSRTTRL